MLSTGRGRGGVGVLHQISAHEKKLDPRRFKINEKGDQLDRKLAEN